MKHNSTQKYSLVALVVLVIVLLVVISVPPKQIPLIIDNDIDTHKATPTAFSVEYKNNTQTGPKSVITQSYPQLTGGNPKITSDINKRIEKTITEKAGSYNYFNDTYELSITSSTTFSSKLNTVSVMFDEFVTSNEMAHPSLRRSVLTFDILTGSQTTLFNISSLSKAELLKKFSEIAQKRLLADRPELKNNPTFFTGTSASENNFSALMLDESGIEVLFNEYQIGPRPEGTPTVFISYSDLGI